LKGSKLLDKKFTRISLKDKKIKGDDLNLLLNEIKNNPFTHYFHDSQREEYIIFYQDLYTQFKKYLKDSEYVVVPVFAEKFGYSSREIRYYINKLIEGGVVQGDFRSQGGIFFSRKSEDEELDDLISKVVEKLDEPPLIIDSIKKESIIKHFNEIRSETKEKKVNRAIKERLTMENHLELALKAEMPLEKFEQLATDESYEVRHRIASRSDLPPYLIEKMATDNNGAVRLRILKRNDLPSSVLNKFAADKEFYIRKELALNKELTQELIDILSKDESESIRGIIASRFGL